MSEFEISLNNSSVDINDVMQPLLAEFGQQHRVHVSLVVYDWAAAWSECLKIGLQQQGPIMSQMGNSRMGSLTAQNTLRAFSAWEITELKGQNRFLPGSWESCLNFDNQQVVAIPWILDTYLVYYQRDLLEKAGVDEASAFSTAENFHATLQKLQDDGVPHPCSVSTIKSKNSIHIVASWVWGQGGDFINPEGTRMLLSQPETRKGLKQYFDLYRFISPETQELNDSNYGNWFLDEKVGVTLCNPELLFRLKRQEFSANIGAAVVPGVPLLGGSNLVVWKHIGSRQEQDLISLIKFMTSADAELSFFESTGLIPANLDALERIAPDPIYAPAIQSVKKGKPFPRVRMWGLVEDKLNMAFSQIWKTLLTTPNPNVEQVIADQLDEIESRLNLTLSQ